jgi:hypothetical protein
VVADKMKNIQTILKCALFSAFTIFGYFAPSHANSTDDWSTVLLIFLLPLFVVVGAMGVEAALFVFAKQFWKTTGTTPQSKRNFFILRNAFIIKLIGCCFLGVGLGGEANVWIHKRRFAFDEMYPISLALGLMMGLFLAEGFSHTNFMKSLES